MKHQELTMNLINEECLQAMQGIPDKSVDMILCDLPYGTTANQWDHIIPVVPLWNEYERIIKDNGAIVLFTQPPFNFKLAYPRLNLFRYEWIWVKENATGFLNARRMPLKLTENILVFYKKLPTYHPQGVIDLEEPILIDKVGNSRNYRSKHRTYLKKQKNFPKNVLAFARDKDKLHPTQKPVALLEYLIRTYTNEGEIILDNCMGSGSTGVACVNTGRSFIGIELDSEYYEVAKQRINKAIKGGDGMNVKVRDSR